MPLSSRGSKWMRTCKWFQRRSFAWSKSSVTVSDETARLRWRWFVSMLMRGWQFNGRRLQEMALSGASAPKGCSEGQAYGELQVGGVGVRPTPKLSPMVLPFTSMAGLHGAIPWRRDLPGPGRGEYRGLSTAALRAFGRAGVGSWWERDGRVGGGTP